MLSLAFDCSSRALAVALVANEALLGQVLVTVKKNHSINLMPTIDYLFDACSVDKTDLDRIVVAQGPGSYTGLRIAVATAKTLAYALSCELVGVSSLQALTDETDMGVQIAVIDARRQAVYAGVYQGGKTLVEEAYRPMSEVIELAKIYDHVTFVGEVSTFEKMIKEALPQAKTVVRYPDAYLMTKFAEAIQPSDVDSFVPNYLKRVEAEENWLKNHGSDSDESQYIKRI